ncbi:MAG: hypothetical protein WBW61_02205 [Rhodanobacteraceae bacterium]
MKATALLLSLVAAGSVAQAGNPPIVVPADVSVGFTAQQSTELVPGQSINFTLSVTNHGPEPVDRLALFSTTFVDEFDIHDASTDCQNLVTAVGDGEGFYYLFLWFPTDQGTLAVGETLSCQLRLVLTSQAPAVFPFGFFIPLDGFVDINPDNDSVTVYLRRAAAPIPSQSPLMLLLLATLLTAAGSLRLRSLGMDRFHTGIADQSENARVIGETAHATAQYRASLGRIFADGFE